MVCYLRPATFRRTQLLLALAVAAAAIATVASALPQGRLITLHVGDVVALKGSHVVCGYVSGSGGSGVECFIGSVHSGPKRGGPIVALPTTGGIDVLSYPSGQAIWVRRVGPPIRKYVVFTASVGDHVKLAGTELSCEASVGSGQPTITCDTLGANGTAIPNSYGLTLSDSRFTGTRVNVSGTSVTILPKHG
jgi:hypothetical protein